MGMKQRYLLSQFILFGLFVIMLILKLLECFRRFKLKFGKNIYFYFRNLPIIYCLYKMLILKLVKCLRREVGVFGTGERCIGGVLNAVSYKNFTGNSWFLLHVSPY